MNKKALGIGSAILLGAGIYIGNQSARMTHFERDEIVMRSKNLIRRLNRGEYDNCMEMFDSNLSSTMSIDKMKDIFTPTMGILGEFQRFKNTTVSKKDLPHQKKESHIQHKENNTEIAQNKANDSELTQKKEKDSEEPHKKEESESQKYISCTVTCQYKNAPATFSILFNENHQICSIYLE